MARKKKQKNNHKEDKKNFREKKKKEPKIYLPIEVKNWIWGILIFIIAAIFFLSVIGRAGVAGEKIRALFELLVGKIAYRILPLIFIFGGIVFFTTKYKKFFGPTILAIFIMILGFSGILHGANQVKVGGIYSGG